MRCTAPRAVRSQLTPLLLLVAWPCVAPTLQALKKHPGDRPTVMEMLHHPWIRTYQRRVSVRIPQAARRRSSVSYNPNMPVHMENGPLPGGPADVESMTTEEIEDMIKRLQMAKQHVGV